MGLFNWIFGRHTSFSVKRVRVIIMMIKHIMTNINLQCTVYIYIYIYVSLYMYALSSYKLNELILAGADYTFSGLGKSTSSKDPSSTIKRYIYMFHCQSFFVSTWNKTGLFIVEQLNIAHIYLDNSPNHGAFDFPLKPFGCVWSWVFHKIPA